MTTGLFGSLVSCPVLESDSYVMEFDSSREDPILDGVSILHPAVPMRCPVFSPIPNIVARARAHTHPHVPIHPLSGTVIFDSIRMGRILFDLFIYEICMDFIYKIRVRIEYE